MKTIKRFMIIAILFATSSNIKAQTLCEILDAIIESTKDAKKETVQDLTTKSFIVNSSSNAWLGGGKTREVVKINLPVGTKKWYYRVTVLDKASSYNYESNETFYYLLSNNKTVDLYKPTEYGVDVYVLGHSGDVSSFLETGNNNFKVFQECTKTNTRTCVAECNRIEENLWLGIKNPNSTTGLRVIVEIVVWGVFN